jgi:DNA-binding NtrC family response regulator
MLIIDDEYGLRFALTDFFRGLGYEVDSAAEREEAEALLTNEPYEVVIADLRLTGTFGIEGLDLVDATRHACPTTRIILLTANGSPEIELEARRRGAAVCLQKPVSLPALAETIGGMLQASA